MRLGSLIRSEPFKAALRVLCVFMVLFILASWTLIRSVETTLGDDLKALIQVEAELLSQIYRDEGREGLLAAIKDMGSQNPASDRVYGLFDERKFSLTGTMSTQPDFIGFDTRELNVLNGARIAGEYVMRVDQFDALTLVVGRNGDMIANARQRLLYGLIGFGGLLILCTLFLGIWAARRSQLRLDEMEAALRDISAGQLDARLPVGVKNDQFDRVARRMNANLAQLERLVSSVKTTASAIAHDLKTPLSHAQIAMYQAAEAVASNAEASDKVGAALAETDKLNSLFETVLRLSRIQTSKDRSMFRVTALKDILDIAINFFEPVAEENNQTLKFSGEDVQIHMDPDMIQQAVINLVQNACGHAGSGAAIDVLIESDEDTVSLIVRDDGPGLPPEAIESALEPFVRGAPDRGAPGHGLGLAMVRAIADLHGATMSLENTALGFEVSLTFPIFKNS